MFAGLAHDGAREGDAVAAAVHGIDQHRAPAAEPDDCGVDHAAFLLFRLPCGPCISVLSGWLPALACAMRGRGRYRSDAVSAFHRRQLAAARLRLCAVLRFEFRPDLLYFDVERPDTGRVRTDAWRVRACLHRRHAAQRLFTRLGRPPDRSARSAPVHGAGRRHADRRDGGVLRRRLGRGADRYPLPAALLRAGADEPYREHDDGALFRPGSRQGAERRSAGAAPGR